MQQSTAAFVKTDEIRLRFSKAMSDMYKSEVPLYGDLLTLVNAVNEAVLADPTALAKQLSETDELHRLSVERHGAIRLGTPEELNMMRRMLAVMGMLPVGYYDLSVAGVPVHATAFRPIHEEALKACPFRLFTSLLRPELISDENARTLSLALLAKRDIFSSRVRELIIHFEERSGLSADETQEFIHEAVQTFKWHTQSTATRDEYHTLNEQHRLLADIAGFKGPHINHLTPRTLDIDRVQQAMPDFGIVPKAFIEGPPPRQCPILLRQTSFKALEEAIAFANESAEQGRHTARFGEVEQRGIALTRAGRKLYDQLLQQARGTHGVSHASADRYVEALNQAFSQFPDDYETLRIARLAYFNYRVVERARPELRDLQGDCSADVLIEKGYLIADPLIYEDFLPVSAAGIFQSNLGSGTHGDYQIPPNQDAFEAALGSRVVDEISLYEAAQANSLQVAIARLKELAC